MTSADGRLLMTLCDGGLQYLLAGAKAGVGLRAGRYMFEVKILEALPIYDHAWGRNAPKPKQICRVGFSTSAENCAHNVLFAVNGSSNLFSDFTFGAFQVFALLTAIVHQG